MSVLGCMCGHVIRDQQDNLSYKAHILRDQQLDSFCSTVVRDLTAFITARAEHREREWLATYFREPYPVDATDDEIVHDILAKHLVLHYSLDMYQCENCGRIWIEDSQDAHHFRSFLPEGAWKGTLAVPPRDT